MRSSSTRRRSVAAEQSTSTRRSTPTRPATPTSPRIRTTAAAGPEPLPAELYSETETALADRESDGEAPYAETSPADPQSLAQMSPRAAEAITAAEGGAPVAQDGEAQTEATDGASGDR